MTSPNPSWDPVVRARVQAAMDHLAKRVTRILQAHSDLHGLFDAESTSDTVGYGDITGIIAVGSKSVIEPIQRELDRASAVLAEVTAETDAWKRQRYGPGYQPLTSHDR